jgi:hypothetical protein
MLLIIILGISQISPAHAGFGDILESLRKAVQGSKGLTEDKIIDGLKEALQIGSTNAVETVSQIGGYYERPDIKIPLPGAIQKVENILRSAGYGAHLDAFEMSMNRAAEKAAPEARGIFWDAIKQMNISDARKILEGRDNEATLYFKDKTYDRLSEVFKPMIREAMSEVGVTRKYQDIDAMIRSMPFMENLSFDLNGYVNRGALDGLFFMLAEEERKIRQDPAARVTDLLKEIFGER